MKVETVAKILSAESKPYNMNGNEGISHRVRILVDGEIFACKSSANQVAQLKEHINEEGDVTLSFTSRKENLGVELVSFAE